MLRRLDSGLLPLQVLNVMIVDICVSGAPTVSADLLPLLFHPPSLIYV